MPELKVLFGLALRRATRLVASLLKLAKLDWPVPDEHCFKLLNQRIASRTLERQITELKIRATVLNRFSQIGTPTTIRVA